MTKVSVKDFLDYIPLIILTICAIILLWTIATTDTGFLWKQIAGLILLPINFFLFWWRHKVGVLGLGVTLLMGLLSLLSYSRAVTTATSYLGSGGSKILFFYGQPVFLLWILFHFVVSGRHYVGILTKKYWQDLFNNSTPSSN